jgi:hypothetical protein
MILLIKIVFVDFTQAIIAEINRKGYYDVIISEDRMVMRIDNLTCVLRADIRQVIKEIWSGKSGRFLDRFD